MKVNMEGEPMRPRRGGVNVNVHWDAATALDNEERQKLREAAEAVAEAAAGSDEECEVEEFTQMNSDEEEDEDDSDDPSRPDTKTMMAYCHELSLYGFSNFTKVADLTPAEWDDLRENAGIALEHEKHLLRAFGITRRSRPRRKRSRPGGRPSHATAGDRPESPSTSPPRQGGVSALPPSMEDELLAMASRGDTWAEDGSADSGVLHIAPEPAASKAAPKKLPAPARRPAASAQPVKFKTTKLKAAKLPPGKAAIRSSTSSLSSSSSSSEPRR